MEQGTQQLEKLYPLDWQDIEVKLAKGRFVHKLRRPSEDLLLKREDEITTEIPIAKDGSYAPPDELSQEAVDAKYWEELKIEATGYKGDVPTAHKAAAFNGLYTREIYVPEDADIFADEVPVIEEIGRGDEPDFILTHWVRQPEESELNKCRSKINAGGRLKPDKRGRQKFEQRSNLRSAMSYYNTWFSRMEGAKVNEQLFSADNKQAFIDTVDPLIKRKVIKVFIDALVGNLLD